MTNLCLTSVFLTFSHVGYITSSAQCLRLYIISSFFLHQFLYLTPVNAGLMCFFNHQLTPTVVCTHLYLVLFLLGIHCHLTLLMHLLLDYLHLKHCIHALKFCEQGTVHLYISTCYCCTLCSYGINSLQNKEKNYQGLLHTRKQSIQYTRHQISIHAQL